MMKTMVFACMLLAASSAFAQFKTQENAQSSPSQSLVSPASSMSDFLGLIDPNKFSMRQNFSLGFVSGGGQGLSLATYTNSMAYQLADPLSVRMDVSLQASPYASSGVSSSALSKLFISNAEVSYHPWQNTFVKLQYQQIPYSQWITSPYGMYRSSSLMLGDQ